MDDSTGTVGVRIHLAGRLELEVAGARVESALPGRQGRLLFAYLVLNRHRTASRDELIDAVWGDEVPPAPGRALSALLSKTRRVLGEEMLEGRSDVRLVLPEGGWVDIEAAVEALERARQALEHDDPRAAWAPVQVALAIAERGLLPGEEAPWVDERRRELEEMRLQALEAAARTGLALGGGELVMATRAARTLIERSPFRESGHRLLMEVLAARGDVAEALRVFEELRHMLGEELGAMPSAAVTAVHDRLLRDAEVAPGAGAVAPLPVAAEAIPLPPRLADRPPGPFVGREAELAQLDAALARAGAGEHRIVLLGGDAGIGKTRLGGELARHAHAQGASALYGRCDEEALLPYQPFVEALRHWATSASPEQLRGRLADSGPELLRLLPELRRRVPDLAPPPPGDPETRRPTATPSSRRSPTCWEHSRRPRRSCWCSTTCTGPTARRCCCCATWAARRQGREC